MASKLRVNLSEKSRLARGTQFNTDNKAESHAKPRPATNQLEHEFMQHAYGNKALQRIAHSLQTELHSPFDKLAYELSALMQQEGKSNLLDLFIRLTPAQKIAALRTTLGRGVTSSDFMGNTVDWDKIQFAIHAVHGVKLKKDEPEIEADVTESGAVTPVGNVDVTGFLAPYNHIIVWLNYKANKQGKAHIMQYFESLSIPQKKIAIHKINKWKKLHFDTFAEGISTHILLQKWVDWDAVTRAMQEAKKIKTEHIDDDVLEKITSQELPQGVQSLDKEQEQDDEEDKGFNLFGLLGAVAASSVNNDEKPGAKSDERTDLKLIMGDPSQMSWLLLGALGAINTIIVILTFYKNRPNKEDVVDRYLNVQNKSTKKARERTRREQLQKFGFKTLEQCYAHIMDELANVIFEKGVIAQNKAYTIIFQNMKLPNGPGKSATKAMIAEKLN